MAFRHRQSEKERRRAKSSCVLFVGRGSYSAESPRGARPSARLRCTSPAKRCSLIGGRCTRPAEIPREDLPSTLPRCTSPAKRCSLTGSRCICPAEIPRGVRRVRFPVRTLPDSRCGYPAELPHENLTTRASLLRFICQALQLDWQSSHLPCRTPRKGLAKHTPPLHFAGRTLQLDWRSLHLLYRSSSVPLRCLHLVASGLTQIALHAAVLHSR